MQGSVLRHVGNAFFKMVGLAGPHSVWPHREISCDFECIRESIPMPQIHWCLILNQDELEMEYRAQSMFHCIQAFTPAAPWTLSIVPIIQNAATVTSFRGCCFLSCGSLYINIRSFYCVYSLISFQWSWWQFPCEFWVVSKGRGHLLLSVAEN